MFNKVRTLVSFIDLLGCALGASIVLMLIFAESKQQAGLEAGSPRDFIYAEFKVNRPEAYVQVYFKTPDDKSKAVSFDLRKGDVQYNQEGYIKLTNPNFYAWGPYYKRSGDMKFDTRSKYYAIYGTSENKGNWEFAFTYFSDKTLDWNNPEWADKTKKNIKRKIDSTSTTIEFRFQNISEDTTFTTVPLRLGETYDNFKILTRDEN